MRILLVITSLGVGGAERLVTNLADRFVESGHQVWLVHFHGEAELSPTDPRVELVNLHMRRNPMGVLAAMLSFRRLMKKLEPDVVNSHLVHANILTRLLRLVTPIPKLISSAHNTNEEGRGRMLAYRLTDRLADLSTNVSKEAVKAFEQQGALQAGRMMTIHNGIDTNEFTIDESVRRRTRKELRIDSSTQLILAVGRLGDQKDYPNLLRAFADLEPRSSKIELAIVGKGPLHQELLSLAQVLGVADRVRFLGIRHDVPALLSAADLFVLSSAWEGFGLVVAEAMACECAAVATDSGGVREVVGDAGFLVPPRDNVALAAAMNQALNLDASEKQQLVQKGRERIQECFSLDVTAEWYLKVYADTSLALEPKGHS